MYENVKGPSATASLELAATAKTKFDEFLRRQLGISNARDPQTVVNALRKLYPTTAARLDDESKGLAIRPVAEPEPAAALPVGTTESPGMRRYRLVKEALESDLTCVMELASNRGYKMPLSGWRDAITAELGEGEAAAYRAVDPVSRDRTFYSVRKLGDYARVARMVGTLNPMVNAEFRRLAATLDEAAVILRVMAGESLFRAGFDEGGTVFQVALEDLRQRREALIGALERFTSATSEGADDWGDGEASYGRLLDMLGALGHQDLRSIVRPDAMSRLLDVLLDNAPRQQLEDLRGIASTVPIELLQLQRLHAVASSLMVKPVDPLHGEAASAPLAAFTTALKLFIDAFDQPGAGAQLLSLVLPSPLASLQLAAADEASNAVRTLFHERAQLQVKLDALHADPNFDPGEWELSGKLDRALYDIDRSIDVYLLDGGRQLLGEDVRRGKLYGWVLERWHQKGNGEDWKKALPPGVSPAVREELLRHLQRVTRVLGPPNLDKLRNRNPKQAEVFVAQARPFLREQIVSEQKAIELAMTLTQGSSIRKKRLEDATTLYTRPLRQIGDPGIDEYHVPPPLRVSVQRLAEAQESLAKDHSLPPVGAQPPQGPGQNPPPPASPAPPGTAPTTGPTGSASQSAAQPVAPQAQGPAAPIDTRVAGLERDVQEVKTLLKNMEDQLRRERAWLKRLFAVKVRGRPRAPADSSGAGSPKMP
jgi:hypothetical protein